MKIKASNFHTLCERSSFLSTKTMKDLNETNSHPSVNRDPVHERAHCQASPGQVNPDPTRGHVRGHFTTRPRIPHPPPSSGLFVSASGWVPPFPFPSRPDPTREALQIEAGEAALARIPPRAAMAEDADASPPPTGGDRKRRHASPVLPPPPPGPPPPGPHKRHRREEGGGGGFDRRRLGPVGVGGHEQDDRR